MSAIRSRCFCISMSPIGALVCLAWFETNNAGELVYKSVEIESIKPDESEQVRKAINEMGDNWRVACIKDTRLSILGECKEALWSEFDMLAHSPDVRTGVLELGAIILEGGLQKVFNA